jgi:hypothetical protein
VGLAILSESAASISHFLLFEGGFVEHIVDQVSFGAIVQVRDRLLEQQARGRQVWRLELGDPSFDIPPHVREAMEKALRDGLTHYTASTGIPSLREAILRSHPAKWTEGRERRSDYRDERPNEWSLHYLSRFAQSG